MLKRREKGIYILSENSGAKRITKENKIKHQVTTGFTKSCNEIATDIGTTEELGGRAYAVYMSILSHRNAKTGECFPSIPVIAKRISFGERTTREYIKRLEDFGFLIIQSGGYNHGNFYWFPKEFFFEQDSQSERFKNAFRRNTMLDSKAMKRAENNRKRQQENIEQNSMEGYEFG